MHKIFCLSLFVYAITWQELFADRTKRFQKNSKSCTLSSLVMQTTETLLMDTVWLHRYLFTLDTVKIFTAFTPVYLLGRMHDHTIHDTFYERSLHKNRNQLPESFCTVVNKTADAAIIMISSLSLIAPYEKLRITARTFGIGALFALVAKDIIKKIETEANLRPWNEKFCKKKRSYGGFPSGHMVEASYMATFFGLEYGLKAAIPLGIFAGISFGVLVNCNRHYASQVVAGAGLGMVYGFAANKLLHKNLSDRFQMHYNIDQQGQSTLTASFAF